MHVTIGSDELRDLPFVESITDLVALLSEGIPLIINVEEDEFSFGDATAKVGQLKGALAEKGRERFLLLVSGSDEGDTFVLALSRPLGIVLASLMMMMPEATIREKLENDEFTEEDSETLFEIGNIIAGNADEYLHAQNEELKQHVKIQKLIQDVELEEDPYGLYYLTSLEIKGEYSGSVVVFMDRGLVQKVWGVNLEPPKEEGPAYTRPQLDESKSNVLLVQGDVDTPALDMESYVADEYNVFRAPDIGAAREILSKERIEMVILDMDTDSPGGISVTKWIKAITRSSRIPVVAFSNRPTKSMVISALKAGAVDFLVVPWDKEKILDKLRVDIKAFGQKNVMV